MSKIRVHELAKELNIESKELITILMEEFNIEVKNHMSTIEDEDAVLIKELLAGRSEEESSASKEKAEGSKSIVDVYEDELADQLNKASKKKKKTKKEEELEAEAKQKVASGEKINTQEYVKRQVEVDNYESKVRTNNVTGSEEIVVICHARTSNKDSRPTRKIADYLSKNNINNFRFDFVGCGESNGDYKDYTVSNMINNLNGSLEMLMEK